MLTIPVVCVSVLVTVDVSVTVHRDSGYAEEQKDSAAGRLDRGKNAL